MCSNDHFTESFCATPSRTQEACQTEEHGESAHIHRNKKSVLNRLARLMGHLESVRRMVEDDRDCSEILIQLSAVKSALNNTGKVILQEHISECIVTAAQNQDYEKIEELNKAIAQFIK